MIRSSATQSGNDLAVAQAAVSAILVVAHAEAGVARLVDALAGAGVALVFSQLLFSPEPARLLLAHRGHEDE